MTTKEKLLALLEDSKGTFFSGEEIARTLQVSRAAVWKAVKGRKIAARILCAFQGSGRQFFTLDIVSYFLP